MIRAIMLDVTVPLVMHGSGKTMGVKRPSVDETPAIDRLKPPRA